MKKYKLVVTAPEKNADAIREAIGHAGGGTISNYRSCSFSTRGVGRFLPVDGASPAIGVVGRLEEVTEERIEVTVDRDLVQDVIHAIRSVHPYEEPAIDLYPLEDVPGL